MDNLRSEITKEGIVGGTLVALGGAGAFGVCHTICQAVIIGLAAIGITVIGMPLAFLQEPWFVAVSFAAGGVIIGMAMWTYLKHKNMEKKHENCEKSGGES